MPSPLLQGKIASQKNPRLKLLQRPVPTRAPLPLKWPPRLDYGMFHQPYPGVSN